MSTSADTSPGKRRSDGSSTQGSPKKARTDPDMLELDKLPANKIMAIKLTNIKGSFEMQCFLGNSVYIVNLGEAEAVIKEGTVIAGYGGIVWERVGPDGNDPDCKCMQAREGTPKSRVRMGREDRGET